MSESFFGGSRHARRIVTHRLVLIGIALALLAWLHEASAQDANTSLGFLLTSPDFPELESNSTIVGAAGDEFLITALMTVSSIVPGDGPQGWSCGVWYAGVELVDFTTSGTAAARLSDGGLVDNSDEDGFVLFETVDPESNGGRRGLVQAIVLSFRQPLLLPGNSIQVIGRLDYRARVPLPGTVAFVRFEDGLVGSGQPVSNEVTVEGSSTGPSRGSRDIVVGAGATPETPGSGNCDDGVDNDGDGWSDGADPGCSPRVHEDCGDGVDNDGDSAIDCEDAECIGQTPCAPFEICRGGLDDDGDGDIDCEDSDCTVDPACRVAEDCDNGVDDDEDGDVDCEDTECRGVGDCPAPERCFNGRDDDLDGLFDCDDPDCFGLTRCQDRPPERCRDGIDNDLDGSVDCDDPDCENDASCAVPEICDNGIDDDGDGDTDCDDSECRGVGDCPAPEECDNSIDDDDDGLTDCDDTDCLGAPGCQSRDENCRDGLDNDIDGLTDCDDPDCSGKADCPPRESCDNGVDDDGDGLVDCDDPSCETVAPCSAAGAGFDVVLVGRGGARRMDGGAGGAGSTAASLNFVPVPGEEFEIVTYIVPFPRPQPAGPQGWSLSIAHDSDILEIVSPPTLEGTDAGELLSGGFVKSEETDGSPGGAGDGAGGGGNDGVVSAVVLSFTMPITLDPTAAQSVLRTGYGFRSADGAGASRRRAGVQGRDGLQGSGQPVINTITIEGSSSEPVHFIPIEVIPVTNFIRGDPNDDGTANIADAVWMLSELMRGGPPTSCPRAADVNDDGDYNVADPVYLVQYRFLDGPSIPEPSGVCGSDLDDELDPAALPCPHGSHVSCRP